MPSFFEPFLVWARLSCIAGTKRRSHALKREFHFRMQSIGQVIYIRQQYSRGPKTVPCGTPEVTGEALDAQLAHKLLD